MSVSPDMTWTYLRTHSTSPESLYNSTHGCQFYINLTMKVQVSE